MRGYAAHLKSVINHPGAEHQRKDAKEYFKMNQHRVLSSIS